MDLLQNCYCCCTAQPENITTLLHLQNMIFQEILVGTFAFPQYLQSPQESETSPLASPTQKTASQSKSKRHVLVDI